MIVLSKKPIDLNQVLESVRTRRAGAIVPFIGTVRDENGIRGLDYESHTAMAQRVLEETARTAQERWHLERISIVHRTGEVPVGEPSVVIAVSAGHRREAFEACRFVIETLKENVPIWKKELL